MTDAASAEKPAVAKNLLKICEGIVGDTLQPLPEQECPDSIHMACSEVICACQCLVILLVPRVGHLQCNPETFLKVLGSTSDSHVSLVGTLKLHLTGQFWDKKVDEIVRAGSKRLQDIQSWADESEKALKNLPEHKARAMPVPSIFHSLAKDFPENKVAARTGQLKELEVAYRDSAMNTVRYVTTLVDAANIRPADLLSLHKAMDLFAKEPGAADLNHELSKWEGDRAGELGKKQIAEKLTKAKDLLSKDVKSALPLLQELVKKHETTEIAEHKDDGADILLKLLSPWTEEAERFPPYVTRAVPVTRQYNGITAASH